VTLMSNRLLYFSTSSTEGNGLLNIQNSRGTQ
jgi:hypothetical protein